MDIIGLAKAALELAKPVMDLIVFNKIMALLNEYEENEKAIMAEKAKFPSWDDGTMANLYHNKVRLEKALAEQQALIKAKTQ